MLISALQHKSNSISNFFEKKKKKIWFPCCSTREDLSIDVSITNARTDINKARAIFLGVWKIGAKVKVLLGYIPN